MALTTAASGQAPDPYARTKTVDLMYLAGGGILDGLSLSALALCLALGVIEP